MATMGESDRRRQPSDQSVSAGLISAVYLVSYLAFSIPALVAGVLATHIGLRQTSLAYGCLIALIAFSALTFARLNIRRQRGTA
jgi:MFS family permease